MSTENTQINKEITLKNIACDARQWFENQSGVVKGVIVGTAGVVGKRMARKHWITLGVILGAGLIAKLICKKR